ncbi:hypothetical protein ACWA1C_05000 [Flectobacillus roseus]
MSTIGLISEGITDQIVIEHILDGLLDDEDLSVEPLQPTRDETDENLAITAGNWVKVFEYCESTQFQQAVENMDFVIIQIDADIFKKENLNKKYKVVLQNLSSEEQLEVIKNKLIELIGHELVENHGNKIIFAISIDSIECWLLPIYYSNKPQIASKEVNCLETLNKELFKVENFTIDKKIRDTTERFVNHTEKRKS